MSNSHTWWSWSNNESSETPRDPLWQNADISYSQQHSSARKVRQPWRQRLQRLLNNISSYCIKVCCSVSLWTKPQNNGTDKSAKAGQCTEWGHVSHNWNHQGHTHWDHEVHARPPHQWQCKADRRWSRSKHTSLKSAVGLQIPNPLHEAMKDAKGSRLG